jgi:tetratricopeptide (TPR) repeat protein
VFSAGWTLDAAEAICTGNNLDEDDVLDVLTALVEKSLVQYESHDGEARYRLLETIRQYSRDRLLESGQSEAMRGRHVDFFLRLAEDAEPKLSGSKQGDWLERLEREHDNLRAALDWCQIADDGAEAGLRLAAALGGFWLVRGYWSEGRERLARALARPQAVGPTAARARALYAAGSLADPRSDYEAACHEESLAIWRELGDRQQIALSLDAVGALVLRQGDYRAARRLFEEALAIHRALGNRQGQAPNLYWLGWVAMAEGDYARAKPFFEEALAIDWEFGHRGGSALWALGINALRQGDYAAARQIFEEDLQIKRELKLKSNIAVSLKGLGDVAYSQEDYETAQALYEEALTIDRELGAKGNIAKSLRAFAALAAVRGQAERAARLFGAAEALREAIGSPLAPVDRAEYDRSLAAARAALGEEGFAAAWAAGRALSLEAAMAFALDETPES